MKKGVLRIVPGQRLAFFCPACKAPHFVHVTLGGVDSGWSFNSNYEKPTFFPSVMARGYSERLRTDFVCHSYVFDGQIRFLGDCSHGMIGMTVPLETFGDDGVFPELQEMTEQS